MTQIPDIRTDRFVAICDGSTVTRVQTRGVELAIDEPEARGGTNTAMSPTEVFMASLAGCVNVVLTNVARRSGVGLRVEKVELECDFETRGVRGLAEVACPFPEIRMQITLHSYGSRLEVDHAIERYKHACPVRTMVQSAGSKISEGWVVHLLNP